MSASIDLSSPSSEGGKNTNSSGIPSLATSGTTLDESIDEWLAINSRSPADTTVSHAKGLSLDSESEDGLSAYERESAELTSRITTACKALIDSSVETNVDRVITVHTGQHVSPEGGNNTTHHLQVAGFNRSYKLSLDGLTESAIAELFAAFYRQWEWWNQRINFIKAEEIAMGKLARAAFVVLQLRINELEPSFRMLVGTEIPRCLRNLENIASFVRSQVFEWMSNCSQDPWKDGEWARETSRAVLHSIQTNQGSVIAMDRFPTQISLQESKQVLVEQPKPPS